MWLVPSLYESMKKFSNHLACKFMQWSTEVNRRYHHWRVGNEYNTAGFEIFEEDWDNLIILDACRYDKFAEENHLSGRLEARRSRGSTSREFIKGNFADKQLLDTAYVSDNPWFARLQQHINANIYHFELTERDAFDGAVTHPKSFTDEMIDRVREFDDKRLILHYVQPHDPYFDEEGKELFWGFNCPRRLKQEGYNRENVVDAYTRTLRLVLSEVERLLPHLVGKTVITADHGEMLGERMSPIPIARYEHPAGVYTDELVKIPWFVIESEQRKTIETADSPSLWEVDDPDQSVDERLRNLGYL